MSTILFQTAIETGRLQERLQQLERIKTTLQRREKIADQILEIQKTLADWEEAVNEHNRQIDFERSGDILSDAVNTYLNHIKKTNPKSWTHGMDSTKENNPPMHREKLAGRIHSVKFPEDRI